MMRNKTFFEKLLPWYLSFLFLFIILGIAGIGYDFFKFLFISPGRFDDFINGVIQAQLYFSPELLTKVGFSQVASPITITYYLFWQNFVHSFKDVYIVLIILWLFYVYLLKKLSKNLVLSILLGFTYPILYLFGRGNPDIFAGFIMMLAFICVLNKYRTLAYILFGVLAAIKIPYILFGIVYLLSSRGFKRISKNTIVLFSSFAFFFFIPLVQRPWSVSSQLVVFNRIVDQYFSDYVVGDAGLLHNSSLFGALKSLVYLTNIPDITTVVEARDFSSTLITIHYMLIAILAIFLIVYWLKNKWTFPYIPEKNLPVAFYLTGLGSVWLPQISADYRLALLIPCIALLWRTDSKILNDKLCVLLTFLLLLPKHFLYWKFSFHESGVTINTLMNGVILGVIFVRIYLFLIKEINLDSNKSGKINFLKIK